MGKGDALKLKFNFNGPDHLEYIFSTVGGHIGRREITVPLPDYVERIQRRKNFRMETPLGTKMFLKSGKIHAVFSLINISLGGAYGTLTKHNVKHNSGTILEVKESVENLGIYVPENKCWAELIIIIKRAEVRRIDYDKNRKIYKYAFEFMEMATNEKKKLVQSIYHFQRQFLQRR
jgi:c-di-GMP-binding flagellar brake protein YcgR